ncbi:NAD(P)H-dependent oxidoreductase [Paenarthrobacter sp. Z7-10]|uniref:flavodoxin family protein n=1 Tax=Paenarthrobacter sp. Z7-10 TaxID=2787635 RepID=UPI0022A9BCE3|nr:NAD(P)H-dependent oxidoreductase [Paenarthrobacter sp. Z7-10]MCZ2403000.1 NAD(P)H-dependent oxidoreductase [Paenarthrobacter sp. Z7-10]
MDDSELKAFALVCTLTPSPEASSSELLARQVLTQLEGHGVSTSLMRVVDHNVRPGVQIDMGAGDGWPGIREQILAADIFVLATPIWMGHPASLAQQVLERLDADLASTDDAGRPIMFDKVAVVAVVGNEDGAHKVTADLFQGLNDVGFTIPAQGVTYWVGEAMQSKDFKDLEQVPDAIASATATAARNAVHAAANLRKNPYPAG